MAGNVNLHTYSDNNLMVIGEMRWDTWLIKATGIPCRFNDTWLIKATGIPCRFNDTWLIKATGIPCRFNDTWLIKATGIPCIDSMTHG